MYLEGKQGYWMDLEYAMQALKFPVELPDLHAMTQEICEDLGKAVHISAMKHLTADLNGSTRLYLLHDRREPLEDEAPKAITVIVRRYLVLVVNPRHRKALTRMLTSQHPQAVERLRYPRRYHKEPVPREMRKRRFGCDEVETVEHALFFCEGTEEMMARRASFKSVMCEASGVLKNMVWLLYGRKDGDDLGTVSARVEGTISIYSLKWGELVENMWVVV
ncbi:hypothetical protein C8J57DRAFT_1235283 [Mycena rebaudengoi]|nr:hypothetical protein C8J57DRAFT_1235283 [Mycena rebaudengoi]